MDQSLLFNIRFDSIIYVYKPDILSHLACICNWKIIQLKTFVRSVFFIVFRHTIKLCGYSYIKLNKITWQGIYNVHPYLTIEHKYSHLYYLLWYLLFTWWSIFKFTKILKAVFNKLRQFVMLSWKWKNIECV